METIPIRGHHLTALALYLHTGKFIDYSKGKEVADKVLSLFERIKTDSTLKFLIVNTLDSVCDCCNVSEEEKKVCNGLGGRVHDNKVMHMFGFAKNKTYNHRKFINRVYAVNYKPFSASIRETAQSFQYHQT